MLSEEYIENLIQPMIDRQEKINIYVLQTIAKRLKQIGKLTYSDYNRLQSIIRTGTDINLINTKLADLTSMQIKDINKIIQSVGVSAYNDASSLFDSLGIEFIPYKQNKSLQRIVSSIASNTASTFLNLSGSTGFMLRDLQHPGKLIPTSISRAYQSIIDEAIQAISFGNIDYNTAIRKSVEQLTDSGVRYIQYNNTGKPYTQRMDTAVRRNILDGIRAVNQGVQNEIGKEIGADGVEITVHQFPAYDHAPVQGHQFTNEEFEKMQNAQNFEDVDGQKFVGFERAIGTLNCRHFTYAIKVGFTPPIYSKKQLAQIIENNEKGYTLPSGKHLTMYECTQQQRLMETKIRKDKEGYIVAQNLGDDMLLEKFTTKLNKDMTAYKTFSRQCGLSIKIDRLYVAGYK